MKKKRLIFVLTFLFGAIHLFQAQTTDIYNLRQKAMSGDADAMYQLSRIYDKQGDSELSNLWFKKAVEKGSIKALGQIDEEKSLQHQASLNYLKREQPKEYFRILYQLAEKEDANAMSRLGELYDTGNGAVSKNVDEALVWYRKSLMIDENEFLDNIGIVGDASRQIFEEYIKKGNTKAIMTMLNLANNYYSDFKRSVHLVSQGKRIFNDLKSGETAIEYYKILAGAGNVEAKNKLDEYVSLIKEHKEGIKEQERLAKKQAAEQAARQAEIASIRNEEYASTLRNFAGVWTCRNSYTQFKFDSKGNGWFRNGSGRAWESLGVTYLDYNKIRVYDAHATHILKYSGGTFTQDNSYVYRRR